MRDIGHRFEQLREAALNLGMNDADARHYADEALKRELAGPTERGLTLGEQAIKESGGIPG